ncbi:MAG TPA: carbohydrate-binding family 9-like protein [candidate division Zixibacteria bacterium]|nr:carbohydrate-binding family 9-like protein [candidate division Zixibacteria bacterium]HBZ00987.1 carbohydrate-binding family 9-like protein [candidate division Zixibacteria bacterium]
MIAIPAFFYSLAFSTDLLPVPGIPYAPQHYICYHAPEKLTIDGKLDEPAWQKAIWTDKFNDIEGSLKPEPRFSARAKLLWDSTYFYVGAELQEPDVWATLKERDAVIYHDNDFEVFIDPDADTHEYYELEVNALNTVWDLLLIKPYRDGGPAVNAWDIQGLKTAVNINGTLNYPGDVDSGWSVEIAIPWKVLSECAHCSSLPQDGDQWKVNFSRVEWHSEVKNGTYIKVLDPKTGKSLPEDNWVWSPQGLIAMHYPEMWGLVQFSTDAPEAKAVDFMSDPADSARWALREIFYSERNYFNLNGRYTATSNDLKVKPKSLRDFTWPPIIEATADLFEATLLSTDGKKILRITQDGKITLEFK